MQQAVQQVSVLKESAIRHPQPQATGYEAHFARLLGVEGKAFAFWKGRVALFAILKALGIGEGDEVIVPAFTCVVVPNAIRFTGARPVYADITPHTYHVDPGRVERLIGRRTRALLIQHTYGVPADLEALLDLAAQRQIPVIEDCCHALGSTFQGQPLGTFGTAAFFSSQWSKPFTTGLGGMAVTRSECLAEKLQEQQALFAQPSRLAQWKLFLMFQIFQRFFSPQLYWRAYDILQRLSRLGLFVGSSGADELSGELPRDHQWRMADLQQATGVQQLDRLRRAIQTRRSLAGLYDQELARAGWGPTGRTGETILLRYPVRVGNKLELLDRARQARVELGAWFETPLHPTPLERHANFGYQLGQAPQSEQAAGQVVNLPLHSRVTEEEAQRIVKFFIEHAAEA